MACQKYYQSLCKGGDCDSCKKGEWMPNRNNQLDVGMVAGICVLAGACFVIALALWMVL